MGANALGQGLTRREDSRLLTGRGRFTADLVPPGAARAVMLRSPHAHATIVSIDADAARAMPGVLAVLTGADYREAGLGGIPSGSDLMKLPGTPAGQDFDHRPAHPALALNRVRFVGDSVAVVVAETEAEARDAMEAIVVDYAPLDAVTGTAAAAAPDAPLVWPDAPGNVCFRWSAGDRAATDAAFGVAAHTVGLELVNNRVHVASLENRGAIGEYDPKPGAPRCRPVPDAERAEDRSRQRGVRAAGGCVSV